MNYLRVIRHAGLQDVKVVLSFRTDLHLVGDYSLEGEAIKILPVTGDGRFNITVKGVELSAFNYGAADKDGRIRLNELDCQLTYDDVKFEFENLMGGGVVGSA